MLNYVRIYVILFGYTFERIEKFMTIKVFIKKLLCSSCCYFTLCIFAYMIITAIVTVDNSTLLLEAGRTFLFYIFSLLIALANTLLKLERPSAKLRVFIHYVLTAFAFYVCLMLPLSMRASSVLVGLVIYTIVYFIILGLGTLFRAKYRSNTEKAQKYEKQFSKR